MSTLRLRRWDDAEFAAGREAWQALLQRSAANALFMSWDWQWRWWHHHQRMLAAELVLLGLYDTAGELVGIAPLYASRARHAGIFRARRLQLIGGAWRDGRPAFSEYLDFIAARGSERRVLNALAGHPLEDRGWDELVLGNVLPDSLAARFALEWQGRGAFVRQVDPLSAHRIPLSRDFKTYVAGLSSGTRRRLVNQRRKAGAPRVEYAGLDELESSLQALRAFKMSRWNSGPHVAAFLDFHLDFAAAMAKRGALRLSRLLDGDRTLSVLYDVRIDGTEYYLESGFDTALAKGMTPGYLHLGFAIEAACADCVECFDLLGGEGRHRPYKRDLCPEETALFCYQVIRSPLLRALYGAHRLLQRFKTRTPVLFDTGHRAASVNVSGPR
ncbi:MAG: GNAT family N-acetyltransferase [Gammaproteobacteria bacterium]